MNTILGTIEINTEKLVQLLTAQKKVTFVNLTYFVDESKSRTVQGKKVLQKLVNLNATLNSNYEAKVNRIIENKQHGKADFEAQAMRGKVKLTNCLLQSLKTNEVLLYATIENSNKCMTTTYYHAGEQISKADAILANLFTPAFLKEKSEDETKGRGTVSLANDFGLISPRLSAIKEITINKVKYVITE